MIAALLQGLLSPLAGLARRSRCCRILLRTLPVTVFVTFVITLSSCYAVYVAEAETVLRERSPGASDAEIETELSYTLQIQLVSTYLMGHWPGRTVNLAISRTGVALVVAQALLLGAFRLALLLDVRVEARRAYSTLVGLSALSAIAAMSTLLGLTIVTIYDNEWLHYGLAIATFLFLPLSQILELISFVAFMPIQADFRRRAVACAVWGGLTVMATLATLSYYVIGGPSVTSSNRAAIQCEWSGVILAVTYYLMDPAGYVSILVSATQLTLPLPGSKPTATHGPLIRCACRRKPPRLAARPSIAELLRRSDSHCECMEPRPTTRQ